MMKISFQPEFLYLFYPRLRRFDGVSPPFFALIWNEHNADLGNNCSFLHSSFFLSFHLSKSPNYDFTRSSKRSISKKIQSPFPASDENQRRLSTAFSWLTLTRRVCVDIAN